MTVCIGVICDRGNRLVVVADRLATNGFSRQRFEIGTKICKLCDRWLVGLAGAALQFTDIEMQIGEGMENLSKMTSTDIVELVKSNYSRERKRKVEELFLIPRNLTWEKYCSDVNLPEPLRVALDRAVSTYDLDLSILLIGKNGKGTHIYEITNPGTAMPYRMKGYHAIGSGAFLANSTLIRNKYNSNLDLGKAVWIAFEAKKRSEAAEGVGKNTDIYVVSEKGTQRIAEETIEELERLYKEMIAEEKEERQKLLNIASRINICFQEDKTIKKL